MQTYVNFSYGVCSSYIAARLKEEGHNPECIFCDTGKEDKDTYRFGREVAERFSLNVTVLTAGVTLFQFFEQEKMIPARQFSPCSIRLKIKPASEYLSKSAPGKIAYGYDIDEEDRVQRTIGKWQHQHITPFFPLIEWQITKAECMQFFLCRGIELPRLYKHFRHANCIPCKNFQINDWLALREYYPDIFQECIDFENKTGLMFMDKGFGLEFLPRRPIRRRGKLPLEFTFNMSCDACSTD